MKNTIKLTMIIASVAVMVMSLIYPVRSHGQTQEPAEKCHAQSVTLYDGRTGIACLISMGSIECTPCGAIDFDPVEEPES